MVGTCHVRNTGDKRRKSGFTLIEMLVALAVLSVATSVILTLFSKSVSLGQTDRSRRTAYAIAEARLADLTIDPSQYEWPTADALASGEPVELPPSEAEVAKLPTLPTTLPTYPSADARERQFYGRFGSTVYARSIQGNPNVYEITAVVRWTQEGRKQAVSLSTTMPLPEAEGGA